MTPLQAPTRRRPAFHPLTVVDVERLTDDAVAVELAVPDELVEEFAFEPGQYLTVRAQVGQERVRRSYSLCLPRSQAVQQQRLRIAASRVPGGVMSTWLLEQLEPGAVLEAMRPMGDLVNPVVPGAARHHVAIAAGSGITPVMSLLGTLLEEEPASRATLVLGNRTREVIMFRAELARWQQEHPDRFEVVHVLSRQEGAPADGVVHGRLEPGTLREILRGLLDVPAVDHWYLCGPSGVVESARSVLTAAGVPGDRVHEEVFHVESAPGA